MIIKLLTRLRFEILGFMQSKDAFYCQRKREQSITSNRQLTDLVVKSIEKVLAFDKKDTVLDIGCADGYMIGCFYNKVNKIYGIDISSSFIKKAKEKFKQCKNVILDNYSIAKIPFNDEMFDKIYMYSTMHYIEKKDLKKMIINLVRICKSNGTIFIGDILDSEKKPLMYILSEQLQSNGLSVKVKYFINYTFSYFIKSVIIYSQQDFKEVLDNLNVTYKFYDQDERLPYSKISFDLVIKKMSRRSAK